MVNVANAKNPACRSVALHGTTGNSACHTEMVNEIGLSFRLGVCEIFSSSLDYRVRIAFLM